MSDGALLWEDAVVKLKGFDFNQNYYFENKHFISILINTMTANDNING